MCRIHMCERKCVWHDSSHLHVHTNSVMSHIMSHIRMGHVTHTSGSRRTHEFNMSHTFPPPSNSFDAASVYMHESRHTYEWWMSHAKALCHRWTSRVISCRTYEWVTSHIWLHCVTGGRAEWRHVAHMNESRCAYGTVTSHIWKSHVAHTNESRRTYEWVTLRIRMSHVAHMTSLCHRWTSRVTSCRTYEWVTLRIWMSPFARITSICHWWPSDIMSNIWRSHVAHTNESCRTYGWVTLRIRVSHVAHMNESRCAYEWVTSRI